MESLVLEEVSVPPTLKYSASVEDRLSELEQQAKNLQDSMRYAGSLQRSILPNERIFQNYFNDAFVLFKPKDIVSGDFYWIYQHHDDIYFAVGDCTGHGVPGALVNIAGNTILRQIIRIEGLSEPCAIMRLLDQELTALFNEHNTLGNTQDGMDIVFCKFNLKSGKGSYCGAGRPLILIRDGELVEFKKGPDAIGYSNKPQKIFETIHFDLIPNDQFYLFSDGYTDQFGGENVKKFNRNRFRSLLLSIYKFGLEKQKEQLLFSYNNWKGKQEQIDDICVVGIKV